jgi:hypothetical protein
MTEAAKASPRHDRIGPQAPSLEASQRDLMLRMLEKCRWVIGGVSGTATKLGMKHTPNKS